MMGTATGEIPARPDKKSPFALRRPVGAVSKGLTERAFLSVLGTEPFLRPFETPLCGSSGRTAWWGVAVHG